MRSHACARAAVAAALLTMTASCVGSSSGDAASTRAPDAATETEPDEAGDDVSMSEPSAVVDEPVEPITPEATLAEPIDTTPPVVVVPTTTSATTTLPTTTVPPPPTIPPTTTPPTPALGGGSTPYVVPVENAGSAGWGDTHSSYPATDIFVTGGCGGDVLSPVNGVASDVRTFNSYDPAVDNPATRGGRSVGIIADDGVRYYMAHFETIDPAIVEGERVGVGQYLGSVGTTGRSSACHVHFGISPPCDGPEWSVRRGVVWPYPYLNAWRNGEQLSPVEEIANWVAANPDGCALAEADQFAGDA